MLPLALFFALTLDEVAPYVGQDLVLTDAAGWTQSGVLVGFSGTHAVLRKDDGQEVQVALAAYQRVAPKQVQPTALPLRVQSAGGGRFLVDGRPASWDRAAYVLGADPGAAPYVDSADRRALGGKVAMGLGAALLVSGVAVGAVEHCFTWPGMPVYCYHRWDVGGGLIGGGVVVSGSGALLLANGHRQRIRAVEAQGDSP